MNYCSKVFLLSCLTVAFFPVSAMAQEDDHAAMVENALSAAPAAIAAGAAVMDGDGNVLREGSNGYTCLPDNPDEPGNSPMCLDETWLAWAHAWMNGEDPPATETISFGYMLQGGAAGESNVDPYAEGPTADNEWMPEPGPPHVMMVVPNGEWLKGLPTTPEGGGPWVMWKDTPLVHVMIPTTRKAH